MNFFDWMYPSQITDPNRAAKFVRIFSRLLYACIIIQSVVKYLFLPKDYWEIFYAYATYQTQNWGSGSEWSIWGAVFAAFILFVVFRLYLRYKNLLGRQLPSLQFYLWLLGTTLITIDTIIFIPVFKGLAFWLLAVIFNPHLKTVKEFLLALNGTLFSWFDSIIIGLFAVWGEKVLPKQLD